MTLHLGPQVGEWVSQTKPGGQTVPAFPGCFSSAQQFRAQPWGGADTSCLSWLLVSLTLALTKGKSDTESTQLPTLQPPRAAHPLRRAQAGFHLLPGPRRGLWALDIPALWSEMALVHKHLCSSGEMQILFLISGDRTTAVHRHQGKPTVWHPAGF